MMQYFSWIIWILSTFYYQVLNLKSNIKFIFFKKFHVYYLFLLIL